MNLYATIPSSNYQSVFMRKLRLAIIFILVSASNAVFAQIGVFRDTTLFDGYFVRSIIVDNEQVPHVLMPTVSIMPPVRFTNEQQKRRYSRLEYNILRVYPYSKSIRHIFVEINNVLDTLPDKKARKNYLNTREDELKLQFEGRLKKLTFTQGRLLIKLIDRETGHTTYEVVKELKGSINAFFWQGIARVFGSNLKSEYDAKGDDWMIEDIVRRIENGQL